MDIQEPEFTKEDLLELTDSDFNSGADDEFAARATGGVRFVTGLGPTAGVQVAAGGGSFCGGAGTD